jgi:hypothetical protein
MKKLLDVLMLIVAAIVTVFSLGLFGSGKDDQ